jgi:hypothetical protein
MAPGSELKSLLSHLEVMACLKESGVPIYKTCPRFDLPLQRPLPQFYGGLSQVVHCVLFVREAHSSLACDRFESVLKIDRMILVASLILTTLYLSRRWSCFLLTCLCRPLSPLRALFHLRRRRLSRMLLRDASNNVGSHTGRYAGMDGPNKRKRRRTSIG